jgi:hypothetical protein
MTVRVTTLVAAVALAFLAGCGPAGRPLDPTVADDRVTLASPSAQRPGNTVAYGHYEDVAVEDGDGVWRFERRVVDFHWRGPEYATRVDHVGEGS